MRCEMKNRIVRLNLLTQPAWIPACPGPPSLTNDKIDGNEKRNARVLLCCLKQILIHSQAHAVMKMTTSESNIHLNICKWQLESNKTTARGIDGIDSAPKLSSDEKKTDFDIRCEQNKRPKKTNQSIATICVSLSQSMPLKLVKSLHSICASYTLLVDWFRTFNNKYYALLPCITNESFHRSESIFAHEDIHPLKWR